MSLSLLREFINISKEYDAEYIERYILVPFKYYYEKTGDDSLEVDFNVDYHSDSLEIEYRDKNLSSSKKDDRDVKQNILYKKCSKHLFS